MRRAATAALLMLAACTAAANERCPQTVNVSFPNFEIPPYVLGTDSIGRKPGILVEWTRKALAAAGCKPLVHMKRRPPNRQLVELELGLLDILPGFAAPPEPDEKLAFPTHGNGVPNSDLAVIIDHTYLYARVGDERVKWDGKTLVSPNPAVGTSVGGASTESLIKEHDWKVELAATPDADIRKLLIKRIDVMLEPEVAMSAFFSHGGARFVRKLEPPVRTSYRYAAVRRSFAAQYPEFTERFWLELCKASRADNAQLPVCR